MTGNRLYLNAAFLLLLPIVVAWFGLSVWSAALFVLIGLIWRWLAILSGIVLPAKTPRLVLETISLSHFVEKVRWCMDRAGLSYTEKPSGGTLGAYFRGRTVPLLRVRTGIVQSTLGNSSDILRYLWGRYGATLGDAGAFLEPTAERLEFEGRLDRYGVNLQIWLYFHLLHDRDLTLRLWGVNHPQVPAWQRLVLRPLFPLQAALIRRSFSITGDNVVRAKKHIEDLLVDVDTRLADGRGSILGGSEINYTDIAFSSMCGLWLLPDGYGGGKADTVMPTHEEMPVGMRADIDQWIQDHQRSVEFVRTLYAERMTTSVEEAIESE